MLMKVFRERMWANTKGYFSYCYWQASLSRLIPRTRIMRNAARAALSFKSLTIYKKNGLIDLHDRPYAITLSDSVGRNYSESTSGRSSGPPVNHLRHA